MLDESLQETRICLCASRVHCKGSSFGILVELLHPQVAALSVGRERALRSDSQQERQQVPRSLQEKERSASLLSTEEIYRWQRPLSRHGNMEDLYRVHDGARQHREPDDRVCGERRDGKRVRERDNLCGDLSTL
jgi:hypothetical protein